MTDGLELFCAADPSWDRSNRMDFIHSIIHKVVIGEVECCYLFSVPCDSYVLGSDVLRYTRQYNPMRPSSYLHPQRGGAPSQAACTEGPSL